MPSDQMPSSPPPPTGAEAAPETKETRLDLWRSRIQRTRAYKTMVAPDWMENIDYRRGKQAASDSDKVRHPVTTDWSATKAKQAQLYSQTPEVRLKEVSPAYQQAVPVWAKKVNDAIDAAKVGVVLDENVPDCVNAAGIAACLIAFESRTQSKMMPSVPPDVAQMMQLMGQKVPTQPVEQVIDSRITADRIAPEDLLWPLEFTGSNFDKASWLGHSGTAHWAKAKGMFKLKDTDRDLVTGGHPREVDERATRPAAEEGSKEADMVYYDEIFYWSHLFDENETHFAAIHRLVFVHGLDEPVIDEPWTGQQRAQDGSVIGSLEFPIRVLTLTYVSGDAIPPSDSAMGRPHVDELIALQQDKQKQRTNSVPFRWVDVNRLDPIVLDSIQRGTWQGIVPVNGSGERALGEVARANYPAESYEYERWLKTELQDSWQISGDQLGSGAPASRSATASNIVQQHFTTRVSYERNRTVAYFIGIVKVIAGLMALYGKFTPEEEEALKGWDRKALSNQFIYDIRADSTVVLDAQQRIERLSAFLNLTAKSGWVDVGPVIRELADLSGVDPSVVRPPAPPKPEPITLTHRSSGLEELLNPLFLAFLVAHEQAPKPEHIEAAKKMLLASNLPPEPPQVAPPGAGTLPAGAPGAPEVGDAAPDWNTLSRIEKRSQDGPGGSGQ